MNRVTLLLKHRVIKNMSALAFIQAANFIIPLLIVPYISRIIGIERYGQLEYARTIVLYFIIFINYGFNYTITREISIHRDNQSKVNEIVTCTYIAKGVLLLLSAIVFFTVLEVNQSLQSISLVLMVTFIITFGHFLFPIWLFQGKEKIAFIAYVNFAIKLLVISSVIVFLKNKEQFWVYNLFLSLAQVTIGIYAIYYMYTKFHIRFVPVNLNKIWNAFKDGFSVFLSTILVTIFASYGFLLLKEYFSDFEVGAYSTANKIAMTIQLIVVLPFSQAFFPHIAKVANENLKQFTKLIKKAAIVITAATILIGLICFIFAKDIILILFGPGYEDGILPLKIIAFLPMFMILNNLFAYQGLLSLKKDKLFLKIHVTFAVVVIGISYVIVPTYGVEGVAYLRIISEIALMLTSLLVLLFSLKKQSSD